MSVKDALRKYIGAIARSLDSAGLWWRAELQDVLPDRLKRLIASQEPTVSIEFNDDAAGYRQRELLAQMRTAHKQQSHAMRVRLLLPQQHILFRSVQLPLAAERNLPELLMRDLEGRTPLRRGDVETGYRIVGRDDGRLTLEQAIVKKDVLQNAFQSLRLERDVIVSVGAIGRTSAVVIPITEPARGSHKTARRMVGGLWFSGATMVVAALIVSDLRLSAAIADLETRSVAVRRQALDLQRKLEAASRAVEAASTLDERKWRTANLRDVIEELTRLLPQQAWLTELRITDKESIVSGYAAGAANLVSQFRNATHFSGAALAAPIVIDPVEGRERFSLAIQRRDGAGDGAGRRP